MVFESGSIPLLALTKMPNRAINLVNHEIYTRSKQWSNPIR